jgi:hypothetical protein
MKQSQSSNCLEPRYFLKTDWTWNIIPESEAFRLDKNRQSPFMKLGVISSPNHEEVMRESEKRQIWY